jgi:hypothetical protein
MQTTSPTPSSSEHSSSSDPRPTWAVRYSPSMLSYMSRVTNVLSNMDIVVPGRDHLQAMTEAGLKAQQLFFAAAMFHPDSIDLLSLL